MSTNRDRASAAGVILATLLSSAPAIGADPCGMVPPVYTGDGPALTRVGVQRTFVFHKDGVQSIVIQPAFEGRVHEFGMLVPFPNPPEIKKVADDVFEQIQQNVRKLISLNGDESIRENHENEVKEAKIDQNEEEAKLKRDMRGPNDVEKTLDNVNGSKLDAKPKEEELTEAPTQQKSSTPGMMRRSGTRMIIAKTRCPAYPSTSMIRLAESIAT